MKPVKPIGYIVWEIRGATPIFADDPDAAKVASMSSEELWPLVDRTDADRNAFWEPL